MGWDDYDYDPRGPVEGVNRGDLRPYDSGRIQYQDEALTMRDLYKRGSSYSGVGPKGYQRSDDRIYEEACQRLEDDAQVDATDIEVEASGGVVTLKGWVPDRRMKRWAEQAVEYIQGVQDVRNEICVSSESNDSIRSQAEIRGPH